MTFLLGTLKHLFRFLNLQISENDLKRVFSETIKEHLSCLRWGHQEWDGDETGYYCVRCLTHFGWEVSDHVESEDDWNAFCEALNVTHRRKVGD